MVLLYGAPWIPSIYPSHVSINIPAPWIRHGLSYIPCWIMLDRLREKGFFSHGHVKAGYQSVAGSFLTVTPRRPRVRCESVVSPLWVRCEVEFRCKTRSSWGETGRSSRVKQWWCNQPWGCVTDRSSNVTPDFPGLGGKETNHGWRHFCSWHTLRDVWFWSFDSWRWVGQCPILHYGCQRHQCQSPQSSLKLNLEMRWDGFLFLFDSIMQTHYMSATHCIAASTWINFRLISGWGGCKSSEIIAFGLSK